MGGRRGLGRWRGNGGGVGLVRHHFCLNTSIVMEGPVGSNVTGEELQGVTGTGGILPECKVTVP